MQEPATTFAAVVWLERLWQDVRYGCRTLAGSPAFAMIAVFSLALGIGANCAIFSFADALLLRPLPVARPSEVFTVGSTTSIEAFGVSSLVSSYRDYVDVRDRSQSFEGLAAFTYLTAGFAVDPKSSPKLKIGILATGNLLPLMGVEPTIGRGFRPDEDQVPGRDAVVVLGRRLWEEELGSDPAVLGRRVRINGNDLTVIGVAPSEFTGLDQYVRSDFFVPLMMSPRLISDPKAASLEARDARNLNVKGRLRPAVTQAAAQAELTTIAADLARAYPDTNKNRRFAVRTELQARMAEDPPDATLIAMLSTLALAVLFVACANVAGLLTSRAPARAREMALRLAIGAGRGRLVRQLVTESLLLAIAGGIAGLGVGYAGMTLFRQIELPTDLPIALAFRMDRRALLFGLMVAIASAVIFGLVPGMRAISVFNVLVITVASLGLMGLGLSIVGLYGLVAYAVSRRTREIGIRMAIGADRAVVLRMVLRQGLVLAVVGLLLGLVASVGAGALLQAAFPSGGNDRDPVALLIVIPIVLAVTFLAAYLPARRASRVNPVQALRYE